MSKRFEEIPVRVEERDRDGYRETHPAYAMIGASRVSGHARMFGSEFAHQNYICVTIREAETGRNLHHQWYYGKKELIEINMSEAQWATFVSSLNVGFGSPCTLRRVLGRDPIPGIKHTEEQTQKNRFSDEMVGVLQKLQDSIKSTVIKINASKLSKRDKQSIVHDLEVASGNLMSNFNFMTESFSEFMERQQEEAKQELFQYAAGLQNHLEKISALSDVKDPDRSLEYEPGEEG